MLPFKPSAMQLDRLLMSDWDLLITDAALATMQPGEPWGAIPDGAIAVRGGRIDWVGPKSRLPRGKAARQHSAGGRWVTPALVDCHTHLLFGGNRAGEFEQRLNGVSYEEIAEAGGGIMSTVRATRAATDDELLNAASNRIASLQQGGVATIEIKSGYGLDLETELRVLRLARRIGERADLTVRTTFLGAHTIPVEYSGDADAYVDFICDDVLPAVHREQLADAVDGYCETIAFSAAQIARVFDRARSLGLPVKLHADQLSDCGGADLAARYNALSADHLEYSKESGIKALADAGTVAVLLPGAFVVLRETQKPPVELLRQYNVPIALASDCNPGTSPVASLNSMMNLATSQFRLTPEECLAGVTRNAARALGLQDETGMLAKGLRADIAEWDIEHPAELSYWLGLNQLSQLTVSGITLDP